MKAESSRLTVVLPNSVLAPTHSASVGTPNRDPLALVARGLAAILSLLLTSAFFGYPIGGLA